MKIVCNKKEFATLVRACYRLLHTADGTGCGNCVLRCVCSDEPEECIECICEIVEGE